jgi:hypothetical protein
VSTHSSEKAIAFLQKKWGVKACPMCGGGPWTVQDKVFQLSEYHGGSLVVGGPLVPVIPVSCSNCGHTVLVNAIIAGAVQSDGSEPTSEVEVKK